MDVLFVFLRSVFFDNLISTFLIVYCLDRLLSAFSVDLRLLWLTFSADIPEVLDNCAHNSANLLLVAAIIFLATGRCSIGRNCIVLGRRLARAIVIKSA